MKSKSSLKRSNARRVLNRAMAEVESLEMRQLLSYALPTGKDAMQAAGCAACGGGGCPSCRLAQQQVQLLTGRGPKAGDGRVFDNGGIGNPTAYQIGARWSSTASGGTGTTGSGITLSWSIVPDGTTLTSGNGEANAPSTLISRLNTRYGSQATWLPLFQQVFDGWSAISGITYIFQPTDDGVAMSQNNNGVLNVRGDVRIGGHPVDGASGVLAYNYFPNFADMTLDTNEFDGGGFFTSSSNNSRNLRNVLAHEHGHGLGFNHVDPTNGTKLMEAFANSSFDMMQFDDMLAVQRSYGDFYEKSGGNNAFGTAVNRGTLIDGIDTVQKLAVSTTTDLDWFKFTIGNNRNVTVNVTPVGPTYMQGSQGGSTSSFNAMNQANLQVALFASNGTTQLAIANTNAIGLAETITGQNLPAGTYFIRVNDQTGSPNAVQAYTLSTTVTEAQAVAVIAPVSPDPRATVVSSININFNEAVNGFDLNDLTLTREGEIQSLAGATLGTANNINYTLSGLDNVTNRAGLFTLTLNASGSGITTQSGANPIASNSSDSWVMTAIAGTAANETFRIVPNGALTDVFINNDTATPTYSFVSANIAQLTVDGLGGDDVFVVDFTNGSPLPSNGVNWVGGTDVNGDTLRIIGEVPDDTFLIQPTALTRSSPLSSTINLSGNEYFDVTTGTYSTSSNLNAGFIVGPATTVALSASQTMRGLSIANGGLVRMTQTAPAGTRILRTNSLTIDPTGKLELFNNALMIDYSAASAIQDVQTYIATARNGGAWDGAGGITSFNASIANPRNRGLGAIEATDYKLANGAAATFFGQTLDDSAVVVRLTYYGDTDLNGVVDFDDYSRIDAGFNGDKTGWFNGDVDGNGIVDFDDYSIIDLAFNTQT
ncbi:MAG: matrixin family metalloprotease [Anaerolineae bacterium]|nr:matrixin family metalloprotease [Phycisphaerae bacterium]